MKKITITELESFHYLSKVNMSRYEKHTAFSQHQRSQLRLIRVGFYSLHFKIYIVLTFYIYKLY
jgi:hypothetical protein